jgi:23S rRNA (guanosine2251-2'-O)-methyltransferase
MAIIYGVNPVLELFQADPGTIESIHLPRGPLRGALGRIARQAREAGIQIVYVDRKTLNRLAEGGVHQGVVARSEEYRYASFDALLNEISPASRVIILDGVQDPRNLGAVVRTAVCAGAAGVIIPERNSARMTAVAIKASAGAAGEARVVRVKNISRAIEELKKRDLWIAAVEAGGGKKVMDLDRDLGYAFVFGSEGSGIRPGVKKHCDFSAGIPLFGPIDSLNVSVAVGVTLYSVINR